MSRKQREISLPCAPYCQAYHTREFVMAELHIGPRQYYRYLKLGLRRAHNGLIRCDWLREFLARDRITSHSSQLRGTGVSSAAV